MARRVCVIAIAILTVLSACAGPEGLDSASPSARDGVDGWMVGGQLECSWRCELRLAIAHQGLDVMHPNHAAVVSQRTFAELQTPGVGRSGPFIIVVFELADGSKSAVGVECNIEGCYVAKPPPY